MLRFNGLVNRIGGPTDAGELVFPPPAQRCALTCVLSRAIRSAAGSAAASKMLCLDRIAPVRKDRPITFALPPIAGASDAAKASAALVAAVSRGEITPSEAVELGRLLETYVKTLEITELEQRLNKLEGIMTNEAN
jgi:hypothetical protein